MLDAKDGLKAAQKWLVEDLDDRFMLSVVARDLLKCRYHLSVVIKRYLTQNLVIVICWLFILLTFEGGPNRVELLRNYRWCDL